MKNIYIRSVGLPKGMPVSVYSDILEVERAAKVLPPDVLAKLEQYAEILALLSSGATLLFNNKYLAEKGALVEGRDVLSDLIAKDFAFPMAMEKTTKKYKDGTTEEVEVPAWTEREHTNKFRAAVLSGDHEVAGFTRTGDLEKDAPALGDILQAAIDAKGPFLCDAAAPERISKPKTPPKYALAAADNIISKGSQAKWAATFQAEGVPFEDFTTPDATQNRMRLAWAVQERENRKSIKEYV